VVENGLYLVLMGNAGVCPSFVVFSFFLLIIPYANAPTRHLRFARLHLLVQWLINFLFIFLFVFYFAGERVLGARKSLSVHHWASKKFNFHLVEPFVGDSTIGGLLLLALCCRRRFSIQL